jgi:CDP-diacylglycerol---glycerol-3-phosphate 3-phosphatidyltransferase
MKPNVATWESSLPTTPLRARQMTGLYALKPWFTRRLTPIVNAAVARRVSPDVFTAAGVVAAGAAAVAIALGCWPLAALFLVLRLAGANLDGAVARAAGVSRPWGFVVNEIGDRSSDLLAFAGLAVFAARQSGPGMHWLSWPVIQVLLAELAATLPTFASLAATAAGAAVRRRQLRSDARRGPPRAGGRPRRRHLPRGDPLDERHRRGIPFRRSAVGA